LLTKGGVKGMSVEDRVIKIVAQIFKTEERKINRETKFVADLSAKSRDFMAMIALLEYEFDIEIEYVKAINKTVGQTVDYVETLVKP
jgi:acyl carrier protein